LFVGNPFLIERIGQSADESAVNFFTYLISISGPQVLFEKYIYLKFLLSVRTNLFLLSLQLSATTIRKRAETAHLLTQLQSYTVSHLAIPLAAKIFVMDELSQRNQNEREELGPVPEKQELTSASHSTYTSPNAHDPRDPLQVHPPELFLRHLRKPHTEIGV
jgi:hypothetical protein